MMFRVSPICRLFSQAKALTDDARRTMKEFYKAIHPDLFEKAPSKVKEENERSLKQLNNYMDCLKKNQGSTSVLLKFYAADKDNSKAKKFLFFQVELPPFLPNSPEDSLKLHEVNAVKKLRATLLSVKLRNNPVSDQLREPEERDSGGEPFEDSFPEAFVKSSTRMDRVREMFALKAQLSRAKVQKNDEFVKAELAKTLRAVSPRAQWVRQAVEEIHEDLRSQKLIKQLDASDFDPRVFYAEKDLTLDELIHFFEALTTQLERNPSLNSRLSLLQNFCRSQGNKLKVMLARRFDTAPGFVIVDIRQTPQEVVDYAFEKLEEARAKRAQIFEKPDSLEQFVDTLNSDFFLEGIHLDEALAAEDAEDQVHKKAMFLKKLTKVLVGFQQAGFGNLLTGLSVRLAEKGVKVDLPNHTWDLAWNFDENRLLKAVSKNLAKSAKSAPKSEVNGLTG